MRLLCFFWLRILVFIVINYRSLSSPKQEERAGERRPFSSVSPLSPLFLAGRDFPEKFSRIAPLNPERPPHPASNHPLPQWGREKG